MCWLSLITPLDTTLNKIEWEGMPQMHRSSTFTQKLYIPLACTTTLIISHASLTHAVVYEITEYSSNKLDVNHLHVHVDRSSYNFNFTL